MDLNALFRPKNVGFALILLLFAAFPKVLTLQETFFYRDFSRFAYPLAFTIGRPFGDVSEFPLWNPYNHCGVSFPGPVEHQGTLSTVFHLPSFSTVRVAGGFLN